MSLYCKCAGDFDLTFPAKVSTLTFITLNYVVIKVYDQYNFDTVFPFFSPLIYLLKELRRADHSVSEYSVPLQHELPGGDH